MQVGMIGLGRMGANMVRRLMRNGHQCVVYDQNADNVKKLACEGTTDPSSLDDFVHKLRKPRAASSGSPAEPAVREGPAEKMLDSALLLL